MKPTDISNIPDFRYSSTSRSTFWFLGCHVSPTIGWIANKIGIPRLVLSRINCDRSITFNEVPLIKYLGIYPKMWWILISSVRRFKPSMNKMFLREVQITPMSLAHCCRVWVYNHVTDVGVSPVCEYTRGRAEINEMSSMYPYVKDDYNKVDILRLRHHNAPHIFYI